MQTPAVLEATTVSFGSRRVLGPVDLTINRGEHWALLGPNGCGKTTLLSLVGAQRHPTTGTVTVLGERLGSTDIRELRRHIGAVGHSVVDLLPVHVIARDIVMTGRDSIFAPWWTTFDEKDKKRADELLERFRCGQLADQIFARCSQGERQRVLLARSLFSGHPFLLLDEPALGVDLPGREALISSLEELAKSEPELATVHVAHTLEELPRSITHAMLLREGEVVASGPAAEVLTSEPLSTCFGLPFKVSVDDGRYSATARGGW